MNPSHLFVPAVPPDAGRLVSRRGLIAGAGLVGALGVGGAGYAVATEANGLVITHYSFTPPRWPAGRRVTLAVVADLHAGGPNMGIAHIRRVVEAANALKPDVTVLLGDYFATHRFITEHVPNDVWAGELARLEARFGVWSIFGNHDWWHGIAGVREAMKAVGLKTMENDAVLIGERNASFWIAGLGDQLARRLGPHAFAGADDLPGTLSRITTDDPVILLAHEPDIFTQVPERVSLTLAGHTHGGQIRVPFLWERWVPSRYGPRFAYGHVVEQGRHMIVSGGLGCSGVPVRMGVPPEIVSIELRG